MDENESKPKPHVPPLLEYSRPLPYMRPPLARAAMTILLSTGILCVGLLMGWVVVSVIWGRMSGRQGLDLGATLVVGGLAIGFMGFGAAQLWRIISDLRGSARPDAGQQRVEKELVRRLGRGG